MSEFWVVAFLVASLWFATGALKLVLQKSIGEWGYFFMMLIAAISLSHGLYSAFNLLGVK